MPRLSPQRQSHAPGRLIGFTFPAPFDALWSYRRRPATDVNIVKAARAAMVWRANTGFRTIIQAGRYSGWLVRFPKELIRQFVGQGRDAKDRLRRSYRGQIADMLKVALRDGIMPRDYYAGNLARHGGDRELLGYIPYHLYETVAVHLWHDRSTEGKAFAKDKSSFERDCRRAGLPVVNTIAVAHGDGLRSLTGEVAVEALPAEDIFLKPSASGQGAGIELWRHLHDGRYIGPDQRSHDMRELMARCRQLCRMNGMPILVQERLENNRELRSIAGSALATTRVVTLIDENEEPEVVEAFYRTSTVPDAAVDNFHQGGLLFPIDVDSGELAAGFGDTTHALPPVVDHPETGAVMAGSLLPRWRALAELALRAHGIFRDLLIVGWDVAYTPRGAVLIEANVPPGISVRRQGASSPLVGTRFFNLLAHHAGDWLEREVPRSSRWRAGTARSPRE